MAQVLNNPVVIVGGGGGGDNLWETYVQGVISSNYCDYLMINAYGITNADAFIEPYDFSNVTSFTRLLSGMRELETAPYIDTTNAQYFNSVFEGDGKLVEINHTYPFTKSVNLSKMCSVCTSLVKIAPQHFEKGSNLSSVFYSCSSLKELPYIDTTNATDINSMVQSCYLLRRFDIKSWEKVTSTWNTRYLAQDCYSLTDFIIRDATKAPLIATGSSAIIDDSCYHFHGTFNLQYNPEGLKDGFFYVPDNLVDTFKSDANWSQYADMIKGISELPPVSTYIMGIIKPGGGIPTRKPVLAEGAVENTKGYTWLIPAGTWQLNFYVPEVSNARTMKVSAVKTDTSSTAYIGLSEIDRTVNPDGATTAYVWTNLTDGSEQTTTYTNLPTGEHSIRFYAPGNDATLLKVTFE